MVCFLSSLLFFFFAAHLLIVDNAGLQNLLALCSTGNTDKIKKKAKAQNKSNTNLEMLDTFINEISKNTFTCKDQLKNHEECYGATDK